MFTTFIPLPVVLLVAFLCSIFLVATITWILTCRNVDASSLQILMEHFLPLLLMKVKKVVRNYVQCANPFNEIDHRRRVNINNSWKLKKYYQNAWILVLNLNHFLHPKPIMIFELVLVTGEGLHYPCCRYIAYNMVTLVVTIVKFSPIVQ